MWSYLLAAVGLTGLWLAGSGKAAGWMLGVAAQGLWIAYAVATRQWGFIATAVAYAVVYLRGGLRARRPKPDPEPFSRPTLCTRLRAASGGHAGNQAVKMRKPSTEALDVLMWCAVWLAIGCGAFVIVAPLLGLPHR